MTEPVLRRSASRKARIDSTRGGDATFHVRSTTAGQNSILDFGRYKREVHGVQVCIELQRLPRSATIQSCDDRWGFGPIRVFAPHVKTFVGEDFRQSIGDWSS